MTYLQIEIFFVAGTLAVVSCGMLMSMKKIKLSLLLLSCLFVVLSKNANGQTLISRMPLPKQHFDKIMLRAQNRDTITCYISTAADKESKMPLVIFIQGSGRHSLFNKDTIANYGLRSLPKIAKGKTRILIIEKPGVHFLEEDANPRDPSDNISFNRKFSLISWSRDIKNAIKYILKSESIESKKVMIMGHSEGGVVAAKVAHDLGSLITHVTILAGEGPTQLYSLYAFARSGDLFDNKIGKTVTERIDSLTLSWKDILKYPLATDKFFFGYTYLRWSSFLSTSVYDQLCDFNGRIYIAQGTADKNVSPESAIFLYTGLLSKGKNVNLELNEDADHSFYNPKVPNGWSDALDRIIIWFLH